MFVLRQINNKINTTVISMSVICLMLFMTMTILSSALSLRNTMQRDLIQMTPVDVNIYKTVNLPEKSVNRYGKETSYTKEQREDSRITIQETLEKNKFDFNLLKDMIEIPIYASNELTWKDSFGSYYEESKMQFPMLAYSTTEMIVKISDYNKVAKLYGIQQYELNHDDEYIMICDFDNMIDLRNKVLANDGKITIKGKEYKSKYKQCQSGFIVMATSHVNTGIILVPDSCPLTEDMKEQSLLIANYRANTEEGKQEIENIFASNQSGLIQKLAKQGLQLDGVTKISIMESSVGLASIITFIAIYLGIIFLIASSAILALKQLTESSDNKQRYTILRKIGCDEKMIHQALFRQIGIFFAMPLLLAVIHSIFGVQFALNIMSGIASKEDLLPSIIVTFITMGIIYGLYFIATYIGSKNIIKEEE